MFVKITEMKNVTEAVAANERWVYGFDKSLNLTVVFWFSDYFLCPICQTNLRTGGAEQAEFKNTDQADGWDEEPWEPRRRAAHVSVKE